MILKTIQSTKQNQYKTETNKTKTDKTQAQAFPAKTRIPSENKTEKEKGDQRPKENAFFDRK
jgi:hypothetical protein